ncbi:MAG: TonB-dependent receptor [Prevotellaceae bacterium]|nr:TonB-dependent receptor [Candidatus Minthosoma caballi]
MKKNFSIKLALLSFLLLMSANVFAQFAVSGTVIDDLGDGAVGASVREKGTSNGVATDINGNFKLNVKNANAVLQVSYVGFQSQEVKVGGRQTIRITLVPDSKVLGETVVVGYGTMKRSDLSGASVTVGEDAIKNSIVTSLDQALQGHAAGVTAVQTSGAPGSSSSIRVRGTATINANAEPLYVIDGVIVQGGTTKALDLGLGDLGNGMAPAISPLATIDPADIVSMEILKDASATAIYGAQGANGVVLITTKHGKAGEAKFSYNGSLNISRQTKRLDMMNLREFATYHNGLVEIGEASADPNYIDPSLLGKGTNWQDAVFQTALQHSHQLSAQGGSDAVRYYVSGSYMNQEGTIIGSKFNRLSLRANLDADLKKWLKMGVNVSYSDSNDDLKVADGEQGMITYSLTASPAIPIYDVDGNYASISAQGYTNPNPIAMGLANTNTLNRQKLNGNIFFEVKPIKDLVWHTELGFDIANSQSESYKPKLDFGNWSQPINKSMIQKNANKYWQVKNYLTYSHMFGKHNVTAMVGQEAWESKWNYSRIMNTDLLTDDIHNPQLGQGTPTINYGFGDAAMASVFTRWTYSYDERYNATYTYRYDGSSNFGPDNRWAGFHSFAASWRFNNEEFMKEFDWLSNGKFRVGWGQTGNANIGGFMWGVSMSNAIATGLGTSFRPVRIANTKIKWESQEQWNLGLDLGFFNNRVNFTADWYYKESKDMLMQLQLPVYMGSMGNLSSRFQAPYGNYGTIRNTGLELALNTHPIVGKFQWDSDFQISFNRNKLVKYDGPAIEGHGQWSDVVSRTVEGESLYNFFGYVTDGYYTQEELINNIGKNPGDEGYTPVPEWSAPKDGVYDRSTTVWVGDIKYKDMDGDGKITVADKRNIGSPMPKFTFGFNNTFRYANFDLNIFINGSVGNKVGNYNKMRLSRMTSTWTNQLSDVLGHAQLAPIDPNKDYSQGVTRPDGSVVWNWYDDINNVQLVGVNSLPRATLANPNQNDQWSDRYIEDGSYVRLKNISLGYTFPKSLTKKLSIDTLRLYCNIQNLVTLTGYSGYDPEVGASAQDSEGHVFGLDNGRYPSPTTYSFGINISF